MPTADGPDFLPGPGDGEETRSFIYVDDCIEGIILVMENGAHLGIYHVGTMEERTIESVARAVGRHFGREIEIVPTAVAVGSTPRRCPDTSRLKALGFAPRVAFEEGLEHTARWYDMHANERPKGADEESS